MNNKGFTLIELLSVIIIIAIIALISTAVIGNVITASKKEVLVVNTREVIKKLELDRSENGITVSNSYTLSGSTVKEAVTNRVITVKKMQDMTGTITFDELGHYQLLIRGKEYCARRNATDTEIVVFEINSVECN